jgi:hypothetical protein
MSLRSGLWSALALGLSLACLASAPAARAESLEAGAATCERAIVEGARRARVPEGVLQAISLTETGRTVGGRLRPWPWAINREGQGHWFASRDEALAFARASLAEGRRSFDVGCFQINYLWHGANFASLEAMFDPGIGADYAAGFLTDLHRSRGDWSLAAGDYHSRTPDKAQVYRARFDRILAGIGGAPLQVAAAPDAPVLLTPRKSRTRLKGPKIITLPPRDAAPPVVEGGAEGGGVQAAIRASGAPGMMAALIY